jgi:hypothetical protein
LISVLGENLVNFYMLFRLARTYIWVALEEKKIKVSNARSRSDMSVMEALHDYKMVNDCSVVECWHFLRLKN